MINNCNLIKFYDNNKKFRGYRMFVSWKENFLQINSWVTSGNYIQTTNKLSNSIKEIKRYLKEI